MGWVFYPFLRVRATLGLLGRIWRGSGVLTRDTIGTGAIAWVEYGGVCTPRPVEYGGVCTPRPVEYVKTGF
jgi:hypothetical protein